MTARANSRGRVGVWYRNPRVRAIFWQVLLGASLLFVLSSLYGNTIENLEARGIRTSFSFLAEVAPFQITQSFSPFLDYELWISTYLDVLFISVS